MRRATTQKRIDKGGLIEWSLFYSIVALVFMVSQAPYGRVYLGRLCYGLAALFVVVWLLRNPWLIVGQMAEYRKNKGDLRGAIALQEWLLKRPRISDKSRCAMSVDAASNYASLGEHTKAIELGEQAIRYEGAFQSARVFPRATLSGSYAALGRFPEAVEQCAQIFALTEAGTCLGGNEIWKGAMHGQLAMLDFYRGWLDEAEVQADKCLEKFPPETPKNAMTRNVPAGAKAVKAAACIARGQLEDAFKLCRQAIKRKPRTSTLAFVHCVHAMAFQAQGDLAAAEAECRTAMSATAYPFAWFLLGQVLHAQGREEEARQSWQHLLTHSPNHFYAAQARQFLGLPVETAPLAIEQAVVEQPTFEQTAFEHAPPESGSDFIARPTFPGQVSSI